MVILGLTGSIGMGKTTAAAMLRRLGVPVYDADATVHRLLGPGGAAVAPVGAAFPEALRDGVGAAFIDRAALGRRVFGDAPALRRLEAILHPMVAARRQRFLARCARRRVPVVALDVPLLFETGGDRRCDLTVLVTAPAFLQAQRVLRRPGMTRARLDAVRAQQMPDREKRRRADFVVPTSLGRRATLRALARIVRLARRRAARNGGRHWPAARRHGAKRRG